MTSPYLRRILFSILALLFAHLTLTPVAQGQTYQILHGFNSNTGDGWFPSGVLVMDIHGTIYGTAARGGLPSCRAQGCGVVFQLAPNPDGTWTETFIHEFTGTDGDFPAGPLIFDSRGNLYGTAAGLGTFGFGTIFELTPDGHGSWSERILHQFTGGADGAGNPGAGLVFDRAGNLYGDSSEYGAHNKGNVYSMSGPLKSSQIILHAFTGGSDGANPSVDLTTDASGNLYGMTIGGGNGYGLVFEMSRGSSGWMESPLYTFTYHDGITPGTGLTFDSAGNLYASTPTAGDHGQGAVFRLTHHADGTWSPTILYSFNLHPDGSFPYGPLTFDRFGNLYGTTANGGPSNAGTVFELLPSGGGHWTERILHSFNGSDGSMPLEGVILDSAGNLYGTTQDGGPWGGGVVFKITLH
jgi:uncharacterized repeat protein (TIGR03803 family)